LIRKLAILGAAVAMPFALLIPSSGAAAPPVDVSNNTVTCNTINKGVIKAKPPLVTGGSVPTVFSIAGKLAGCSTDASGVVINDFKSSFKGTISAPSNDCGALLGPSTATGQIIIKWNTTPKITPSTSTIDISSGDLTTGVFSSGWGGAYGYFGLGVNPRPSGTAGTPLAVSGAFTGGDGGASSTADAVTQEDIAVILGQCSANGVKALNIGIGQIQLS
jgi:hypothetical protein